METRKVSKGLDCSDIFRFLARKHHSLLSLLLCFHVTAHKTYILENVESSNKYLTNIIEDIEFDN